MIFKVFIITCSIVVTAASAFKLTQTYYSYDDARSSVIEEEDLLITGGTLNLNSQESKVDEIFRKHKYDELQKGLRNPQTNAASMHFFKAKPFIESSKIFKFLQKMPKGAVLHMHTSASVSSDWVVKNIFYMGGLMKCTTNGGVIILTFRHQPDTHGCATKYMKVNNERQKSASIAEYDRSLEQLINLHTSLPEVHYSSTNEVWRKFQNMFQTIADALQYLPAYRLYHWQMLEELYNDNVMYAEVRLGFNELYNTTGHTLSIEQTVKELIAITEKFKCQHPDFLGIKMIYGVNRRSDHNIIKDNFELFKKLHLSYPNYIIGFDLVGQEDLGKPLYQFVNILSYKPKTSKFFFHAGETNLYGASTDNNLLDALLLNTTRIGHGYALMKHPVLYRAVKDRDIAIEISPVSNQVLELVSDLRNHPGSFYISQNLPIVICNDDPGFWNSKALSFDFYYTIMSMAPINAGLKTLKQLVWNSIKYSTMTPQQHENAFSLLQIKWNRFINDVLKGVAL